ncbi:hypothetical protein [Streptomyces sp. CRN 30]|uniref:hypothetical protein n=1 Tax=Streptomyces sp. CRN 30 TaxID=3075613 RepID=UPI002A8194B0|nr:hypothetical protein [Streptomyces sp. CRN 30]
MSARYRESLEAAGSMAEARAVVEGFTIHNSMDAEPLGREDVAAVVRAVTMGAVPPPGTVPPCGNGKAGTGR